VYTPTDRLARESWGAELAWQTRRPNNDGVRGALANQSPTSKARAPSDR